MTRSLRSDRARPLRPLVALLLALILAGITLPATAAQRAVLGEVFSSAG
jgi:hypothetical protein